MLRVFPKTTGGYGGVLGKNQRYNPNVAALAKNLLSFYEDFAAKHADRANTYAENQLDALLDSIGRARVDSRV